MVSPLMLGTVEFGSKVEEVEARRIFDVAVDAGINLVDTVNVYAGGRSEEIVGRLIASAGTEPARGGTDRLIARR
jgi:aryl-alcohol dehydrogenase-like predicted oxidoreductase